MGSKIPQRPEELENHLQEQLQFLEASAHAYDRGFDGEARRMAATIRILVHDKGASRSLLRQTGRKDVLFLDTASERDPRSAVTYAGLLTMTLSRHGWEWGAPLDLVPQDEVRRVPFQDWWERTIFVDEHRNKISRKQLVLSVAETDGGHHVDPTLTPVYARLSRDNSLAFIEMSTREWPSGHPHLAAIRQIAHEVLKTFKPPIIKYPPLPTRGRTDSRDPREIRFSMIAQPIRRPPSSRGDDPETD